VKGRARSLDLHVVQIYNGTAWPSDPFAPLVVAYTATDYTSATAATATFTALIGSTYRVSAGLTATQITATGTPTVKLLVDAAEQFRLLTGVAYGVGITLYGVPVHYVLAGDGASHTVTVTIGDSAGAVRVANCGVNVLLVEQIA